LNAQNEPKLLTSSGWRGMGYTDMEDGRFIHKQLNLSVGEYVYCLGERFKRIIELLHHQ